MSILSAVDCGTLHMIKNADRYNDAVISDSNVDDAGGWVEADLSAYVPNGTKAVLIDFYIQSTDASDMIFWYIRADSETNATKTRASAIAAQVGAVGYRLVSEITIWAPNGVFEYKGHDTYPIVTLLGYLKGYYL